MTTCYLIPLGKPRMTRRDKFIQRPAVVKYRIFADALRACMAGTDLSDVWSISLKFYLPFPKSYNAYKRSKLGGKIHRLKPDIDNCSKAVMDALLGEDSQVAGLLARKYWEDLNGPRIEISINEGTL